MALAAVVLFAVFASTLSLIPTNTAAHWILQRMPAIAGITLVTTGLAAALATVLAPTAARHGARVDRTLTLIVLAGHVLPAIWVGLVLSNAVVPYPILPGAIVYVPLADSTAGWLGSVAAPIIALTVSCVASVIRQLARSSRHLLDSEMVNTLRSRGLSTGYILRVHVLPRAIPAAVTLLELHFLGLLAGILLLETVVTAQPDRMAATTLPDAWYAAIAASLVLVLGVLVHLIHTLVDTLGQPQQDVS